MLEKNPNPYAALEERAFWAPAVARRNMFDIRDLWRPAFAISPDDRVATFGSCFAQHIGRALRSRGFNWLITEPGPSVFSESSAQRFNYGIFTCRTGNIYTPSLLGQWLSWISGGAVPDEIWENGGRFFDPFRPVIEPEGFDSAEELLASRAETLEALKAAVKQSDVFVFTLGLTESWFNRTEAFEYPMCPGTAAGTFDAREHIFVNQEFPEIRRSLTSAVRQLRKINGRLRILLTVSPVPLTATMSGNHVLVATMESKSVLRAVAGMVAREFPFVDYFPSYEIINGAPFRGAFFEPNQRSVNPHGVKHVMDQFFSSLSAFAPEVTTSASGKASSDRATSSASIDVCEEELLGAFAPHTQ